LLGFKAACSRYFVVVVVHMTTSGRVGDALSRGSTNIDHTSHHVDEFVPYNLLEARDHFVHTIV
jgi:hypothetical protein